MSTLASTLNASRSIVGSHRGEDLGNAKGLYHFHNSSWELILLLALTLGSPHDCDAPRVGKSVLHIMQQSMQRVGIGSKSVRTNNCKSTKLANS